MAECHVLQGDSWPPLILSSVDGPVDLSPAVRIRQSIDDGEWEVVEPVDAAAGTLRLPILDVGRHKIDIEVTWGDQLIEVVRQPIVVEERTPIDERETVYIPPRSLDPTDVVIEGVVLIDGTRFAVDEVRPVPGVGLLVRGKVEVRGVKARATETRLIPWTSIGWCKVAAEES